MRFLRFLDGPGLSALAALVCTYCLTEVQGDDYLNTVVTDAVDFSDTQLKTLVDVLDDYDVFADYTDTDGVWQTDDKTVWTSGMTVGLFWYQYAWSGDDYWKEIAENWQEGLQGVEELDDNDVGFQVMNSFGLGYLLTGESDYKDTVLTGADTLYDLRYKEVIPAFWSWSEPSRRPEWECAVNVDMMMNMEIMLWASQNGGNSEYYDAAIEHADTTWKDIVRDDNSTYHVADYDPDTGELVDQGTYQGADDESTWSRGQAWAVYGYLMLYRYTGEARFLDYFYGVLGYFIDNLPDDNIAHSDFEADYDDDNLKDTSATAIVASSLLEAFQTLGEPYYLEKAVELVTAIVTSEYFQPDADDDWQSFLRGVTSEYAAPETGSIFGDYYLVEFMIRYKYMAPSILLRNENSVRVEDNVVVFDESDLDNDVDLSGLDADKTTTVWANFELDSVAHYPTKVELTSSAGDLVEGFVTAPDDGWKEGENKVTFSIDAGSFSDGSWSEVTTVTIGFSESDEDSSSSTDVTVESLIVGQSMSSIVF